MSCDSVQGSFQAEAMRRCHRFFYCSKECQTADWSSRHKRQCPLFVAFWKWHNETNKESLLGLPTNELGLVWFDDGSDDEEHWMKPSLALELKDKPRLRERIIFPATAAAICTTGSDADWNWVVTHAAEIGLDVDRVKALSMIRR